MYHVQHMVLKLMLICCIQLLHFYEWDDYVLSSHLLHSDGIVCTPDANYICSWNTIRMHTPVRLNIANIR